VGNVPSFSLLLLDADQNLVFRRIFVALDAGVAEVRGVENLPQVVEVLRTSIVGLAGESEAAVTPTS